MIASEFVDILKKLIDAYGDLPIVMDDDSEPAAEYIDDGSGPDPVFVIS